MAHGGDPLIISALCLPKISVWCLQIQDAKEFFKSPEGAKFFKKSPSQDEERVVKVEANDEVKEAGEEMEEGRKLEEGETNDIAEGWLNCHWDNHAQIASSDKCHLLKS